MNLEQSAFETSEDLLTAIFEEEELQKKGASSGNSESKRKPLKKQPESKSNKTTGSVSETTKKSPGNVEKKDEVKQRNKTVGKFSLLLMFVYLLMNIESRVVATPGGAGRQHPALVILCTQPYCLWLAYKHSESVI